MILGAPANAQLGDWGAVPSPAGSTAQLEHAIAIVQNGADVTGYSCYTRSAAKIHTKSGSPIITKWNEHFIVQDGVNYYGFSARTGQFSTLLTFSPSGAVASSSASQTWMSAVQEGTNVHLYFAFTGAWESLYYNSPPQVQVTNFCATIGDGNTVWAVSCYYGNPVPLFVAGASPAGVYGTVAVATSPGFVHCFSAHQNAWSSMPVAGTASVSNGFAQNPGFVKIVDANSIAFFSGSRGVFTTLPVPSSTPVYMHRQCAIAVDGLNVYGYSALLAKVSPTSFANPVSVTMQHYYALIDDGVSLTAFSAPKGEFSNTIYGIYSNAGGGQNVAVVTDPSGATFGYSGYTNQWLAGPVAVSPSIYVGAMSAVIVDPGIGYYGMSAQQTGGWVYYYAPAPTTVYNFNTPQGLSEIICARNGNKFHLFNPRSDIWRDLTIESPSPTAVAGHLSSMLVVDGTKAYGFGIYNDRWTHEDLLATPLASNVKAQVCSGSVYDGSALHVYSALGQLTTNGEYPEYFRTVAINGQTRVELAAEPGSLSVIFASLTPMALPTEYGMLYVDPSNLVVDVEPTLSPCGAFDMALHIPNDPSLSGTSVYFQSLVVTPAWSVYLTNPAAITIY